VCGCANSLSENGNIPATASANSSPCLHPPTSGPITLGRGGCAACGVSCDLMWPVALSAPVPAPAPAPAPVPAPVLVLYTSCMSCLNVAKS
jgi:hypothetical protein